MPHHVLLPPPYETFELDPVTQAIGVDWDGEVARLRDAQDWDAALKGACNIAHSKRPRRRESSFVCGSCVFGSCPWMWACMLAFVHFRLKVGAPRCFLAIGMR